MSVTADGVYIRSTHRAHLSDVIFYKRACSPPINTEILILSSKGAAVVADSMVVSRIPAFAGNDIPDIGPTNSEITSVRSRTGKGNASIAAADITLPEVAMISSCAGCRLYVSLNR